MQSDSFLDMMGLRGQSLRDLMRGALDLKGLGSFENAREVLEHLASEHLEESSITIESVI
ncbi:MAG: hypothetical protein ACXACD_04265 [Candidatus Thorarchaeota archaeon]